MAEWFVRRGDKQAGPFSGTKLKELAAAGKVLPTDELRQGADGAWVPAARAKGLFAATTDSRAGGPVTGQSPAGSPPAASKSAPALRPKPPPASAIEEPPAHLVPARPAPLVPIVEQASAETSSTPLKGMALAVQMALLPIRYATKGSLAIGGSFVRSRALKAQRRHELELAKIQTQGRVGESAAAPAPAHVAAPAQPVSIVMQPTMVQNTVVRVTQKAGGRGCGCGGCLLMIVLLAVAATFLSSITKHGATSDGKARSPAVAPAAAPFPDSPAVAPIAEPSADDPEAADPKPVDPPALEMPPKVDGEVASFERIGDALVVIYNLPKSDGLSRVADTTEHDVARILRWATKQGPWQTLTIEGLRFTHDALGQPKEGTRAFYATYRRATVDKIQWDHFDPSNALMINDEGTGWVPRRPR
ncbi:MAG: DUF4339 domain-containing protein [Planctomycetia bacterium]|nr:DUF4339 domain-containing protein [Planctomycetia bacterium]